MLPPTQFLREETLTYKTSTFATSIFAKRAIKTVVYNSYSRETGAPAPLNQVDSSRLSLTYSTMLNTTRAPIENKRQPNLQRTAPTPTDSRALIGYTRRSSPPSAQSQVVELNVNHRTP